MNFYNVLDYNILEGWLLNDERLNVKLNKWLIALREHSIYQS